MYFFGVHYMLSVYFITVFEYMLITHNEPKLPYNIRGVNDSILS